MAFLERLAKNRLTRVAEGKIPGLSQQDCRDQQALLAKVLGMEGDDTTQAMDHGDFKPDNIIVDEEYNIKGYVEGLNELRSSRTRTDPHRVVDWSFADMVPISRAAGFPRFLWPASLHTAPSPTVQADRRAYIASVAAHTSGAASHMQRWQTGPDVDIRTLFLESLFSKGMHIDLARVGWKLPYCELVIRHRAEEQRAWEEGNGEDLGSSALGEAYAQPSS